MSRHVAALLAALTASDWRPSVCHRLSHADIDALARDLAPRTVRCTF
jgi:hypothetical protein